MLINYLYSTCFLASFVKSECTLPKILQGTWFSWETGTPTITTIDQTTMTNKGVCHTYEKDDNSDYTIVFKSVRDNCYYCVKTYPRTINIFEKIDSKFFNHF